jgi:hypothetical protein
MGWSNISILKTSLLDDGKVPILDLPISDL